MAKVAAHLGVAELQAGYRDSGDAVLVRQFRVVWFLSQGRRLSETVRPPEENAVAFMHPQADDAPDPSHSSSRVMHRHAQARR